MKLPLICVLGCGGAVGSVVCGLLQPSYRIRGGQRRQLAKSSGKDSSEWVQVDLYDSKSLSDFCAGCDVIVNCAAPSYHIGDRVALAAVEAGAYYIDSFGGDPLEQSLSERNVGGLFVISAGVSPGLSGILPRWLFAQGFEIPDSIHVFAGGRERYSSGSVADFLLSSIAGFGVPDAYWRNGSVIRCPKLFPEGLHVPGFKGEVYVKRYLTSEAVRLAKRLKLREAHYYNVNVDKRVNDTILRCCARLMVDNSNAALEESVSELVTLSSMVLSEGSSWYTMMIEAQGITEGKTIRKRAILQSPNSSQITGGVIAIIVETILQQTPDDGVYWAFELLNPAMVVDKLLATKAVESLDVVEIPPINNEDPIPNEVEEGVL